MADPNATVCAACGASGELHEHHLVPKIEGGAHLPTVKLCTVCHGLVHGRRFSSQHAELTRKGLERAKARGVKLGNPRLQAGNAATALVAVLAKREIARRRAKDLMPFIEAAQKAGCFTLGQIADALVARGIKTPGGATFWNATQVRRIIAKAGGF